MGNSKVYSIVNLSKVYSRAAAGHDKLMFGKRSENSRISFKMRSLSSSLTSSNPSRVKLRLRMDLTKFTVSTYSGLLIPRSESNDRNTP